MSVVFDGPLMDESGLEPSWMVDIVIAALIEIWVSRGRRLRL